MENVVSGSPPRRRVTRRLLAGLVGVLAVLLVIGLLVPAGTGSGLQSINSGSSFGMVLALALPAYLAGIFSLLSPCCLPILPAYFSITFGAKRQRVVSMSVAFFLGLATTMVVLGASLTALGSLIFPYRDAVSIVGGVLIAGFGIMLMLGKGFSGMQLQDRPAATLAGTYLYGLTFAFGWTACVGPILGAVLTALATTGISVLAGAMLAFVYALGIATPLTLIAAFFGKIGASPRVSRFLRGRGFEVKIAGHTLYLHTTSIISGVLLLVVGWLLATGQLYLFTQRMATGSASGLGLSIEDWLARFFHLGG